MTHREWIKKEFKVLAETPNAIFFEAYGGELCCEINGLPVLCNSVMEFYALVEFYGDDDFSE